MKMASKWGEVLVGTFVRSQNLDGLRLKSCRLLGNNSLPFPHSHSIAFYHVNNAKALMATCSNGGAAPIYPHVLLSECLQLSTIVRTIEFLTCILHSASQKHRYNFNFSLSSCSCCKGIMTKERRYEDSFCYINNLPQRGKHSRYVQREELAVPYLTPAIIGK
jgi:hypothetical protein